MNNDNVLPFPLLRQADGRISKPVTHSVLLNEDSRREWFDYLQTALVPPVTFPK